MRHHLINFKFIARPLNQNCAVSLQNKVKFLRDGVHANPVLQTRMQMNTDMQINLTVKIESNQSMIKKN